jgi:hypothetical protein
MPDPDRADLGVPPSGRRAARTSSGSDPHMLSGPMAVRRYRKATVQLSLISQGLPFRRRDTVPAVFHYLSTTGEDSRGLQGNELGNKLIRNSLPPPELTTKVARRRRFSKRAA